MKKRLEWAFTAVVDWVSIVFVVFGETSGADVKEGCTGLSPVAILVVATLLAVEHDADVVGFHIHFRYLVDVRVRRLLLFAGVAGATAAGVLVGFVGAVRASGTFLVRVALRVMVISTSQVLQSFIDGLPGISPLEGTHLPSHVDLLVNLQHGLVFVVEGHVNEKLEERQFVGQLVVESGAGCLGSDFGNHTIHKLVEGEIHVRGCIVTWVGLEHFVGPGGHSEDHGIADLVIAGSEDFPHFGNVG